MFLHLRVVALAAILSLSVSSDASADNWPAWRGPLGTGHCKETNLPLTWSNRENIKWKVELPDAGNSTPIVWGDRVFISQAENEGKLRSLICFHRADGRQLWKQTIEYDEPETTHRTNPYCSSSPATDGQRIFVWHGSAGFFAYDLDGKELWRKDLGQFEHIWGNASSPVLYDGKVILHAGPGTPTFLVAMDQESGEEIWRNDDLYDTTRRGANAGSWSTPVIYQENGRDLLLLSVPHELAAFNPADGSKVWRCEGLTQLVYTSPLVGKDLVVAMSGYGGAAIGVRTGGSGTVTESHQLWRHPRNPQRVGSGIIVGDHIYILHDSGVATCYHAATGEEAWSGRLAGTWSSMVHADGRLYILDSSGNTHVLKVTPEKLEVLATNRLGESTRSSLAISDGQIFIRTYRHLYCIDDDTQ